MTLGGDSGYSCQPDIVEKIILDLQNTNLSQSDIAQKYNIHQTTVSDINIGDTWFNSSLDYPLRKTSILLGIGIEDKCPICGKEKSRKAKTCLECYKKQNPSKIPSREELKQMIRQMSFVSIGKEYGVSDNTVRKWCDKYSLPRKVSLIKQYSEKQWEEI